jgi:quercetin dioxygenase-like cupin family protein
MSQKVNRLVQVADDNRFVPIGTEPPGYPSRYPAGYRHDPRDQGSICRLISRVLVGSEDIAMGVGRWLPGQYHTKHHHPNGSEFYYVTSGECVVQLDGEEVRADKGTAIYIPPNTVHAVRNESAEVVELVYGLSRPEYSELGHVYDE